MNFIFMKTSHPVLIRFQNPMLEAGVPLPVIKSFLGHSQLATTEIYASLSQEKEKKKVQEWNAMYWSHCVPTSEPESTNIPAFLAG